MTDLDRRVDTVLPAMDDPADTAATTALTVDAVGREIGGRAIVDDVTFDVADGELFVLVGPSGNHEFFLHLRVPPRGSA